MSKVRRLGVAGGAALLTAALVAPAGTAFAAAPAAITDKFGGVASGEVLDLHLLGRHVTFGQASVNSLLDSIAKDLKAEAKGVSTLLVPGSTAIARFNDPAATGGEACALPQVQEAIGILDGAGPALPVLGNLAVGGLLPKLELNVGCATANVAGNHEAFLAESVGGILQVRVALPEAVQNLVGTVRGVVGSLKTGSLPIVGDLGLLGTDDPTAAVSETTDAVSGLLGSLTGTLGLSEVPLVGGTVDSLLNLEALAPVLSPADTVDDLLAGIEQGDLVRINLGVATAKNSGDVQSYLSQAIAEGGSIELLPNFGGLDKPLLKINVAKSSAKVIIDRATTKPEGIAENTLVRVESALLPNLNLSGLPIIGGLLGSTGLPVVDSVVPMVNGLLGGVPVADKLLGNNNLLPFDATVKGLGLKSGAGFIELGPGMSVSLLCDGPVTPLCTEISVGAAKAPVTMPDGRMRVESSAVTIHLLKNLNTLGIAGLDGLPVAGELLKGLSLGSILANDTLGGIINPLLGSAGLSLGEPSDVAGIKISLAHAMAEAGGTRVMGQNQEQARELAPVAAAPGINEIPATLPRTGGLPFTTAIPFLLGASAGLRALVRRRNG